MKKLSIGDDSTLGSYFKLCRVFFGAGSAATRYLEEKVAAAPNGTAEDVLADEGQMVYLLARMHLDGLRGDAAMEAREGQGSRSCVAGFGWFGIYKNGARHLA